MRCRRLAPRQILGMAAITCTLSLSSVASAQTVDCTYDHETMMTLGQNAFDQDMKGGWRGLADKGCLAKAANLIRDYRLHQKPQRDSSQSVILFWHEGQTRALLGETDAAIALFDNSRTVGKGTAAWNLYVDATIFFLKQDRTALIAARDAMSQLGLSLNLNVVENLVACFGRTYKEAYSGCKNNQHESQPRAASQSFKRTRHECCGSTARKLTEAKGICGSTFSLTIHITLIR